MAKVAIADGLFTSLDSPSGRESQASGGEAAPHLIGSRCGECAIVTFPSQDSCPRCGATTMEAHPLARRGRLWAWTTQEFPPPSPPYAGPSGNEFVPFGVGYIDLGDVKVEARLTTADVDVLRHDMEMELVLVPLRTDADGTEVLTFAFSPCFVSVAPEQGAAE